jgi:hypothetical protein
MIKKSHDKKKERKRYRRFIKSMWIFMYDNNIVNETSQEIKDTYEY